MQEESGCQMKCEYFEHTDFWKRWHRIGSLKGEKRYFMVILAVGIKVFAFLIDRAVEKAEFLSRSSRCASLLRVLPLAKVQPYDKPQQ